MVLLQDPNHAGARAWLHLIVAMQTNDSNTTLKNNHGAVLFLNFTPVVKNDQSVQAGKVIPFLKSGPLIA